MSATRPQRVSSSGASPVAVTHYFYPSGVPIRSMTVSKYVRLPRRVTLQALPRIQWASLRELLSLSQEFRVKPAQVTASMDFPDPVQHLWVRTSSGRYRFGTSQMPVKISIQLYVNEDYKPAVLVGDVSRERRFAVALGLILSHEALHVQDAIELAQEFPRIVAKNPQLRRILVDDGDGQPKTYSEAEFQELMRTSEAAQEQVGRFTMTFRNTNKLQRQIAALWMVHWTAKDVHDTPDKYEAYRQSRAAALAGELGKVVWPDGGRYVK